MQMRVAGSQLHQTSGCCQDLGELCALPIASIGAVADRFRYSVYQRMFIAFAALWHRILNVGK